ncbi:hypothetical protein MO973_10230 [Paenibacillus sp. TRM 82003]|nr:hypothetical protein [Paenibacillus sp. TRM 82003]
MACQDCGCEFAFDAAGNFVAKDYFIKGYTIIENSPGITPFELSKETGLHRSISRRTLAYFQTRMKTRHGTPLINLEKQKMFIAAVSKGVCLEEIEKWSCWQDGSEFLMHRYHISVMRELIKHKRSAQKRVNKEQAWMDMVTCCEEFLVADKDITLGSISKQINVSANTLRKWGFNTYINKAKERQGNDRLERFKANLRKKVDKYFEGNEQERIRLGNVYSYIGVRQSQLCGKAPDVVEYISCIKNDYSRYSGHMCN